VAVSPFRIVPAAAENAPLVLRFIRELAEYERLSHEVVATEERIREVLSGPSPPVEAVIAYAGEDPAGFALFFHHFSTFTGRRGLYLEDLFVRPEWRGRGLGRRLLARVARVARDRGCLRLEWAVLDWNESAIAFYKGLGARPLEDWIVYRLAGEALERVAAEDPGEAGDPGRRDETSREVPHPGTARF
jgi:GNAT superfamily N-acetyltransferase